MSNPKNTHKARALKRIQLMINDWFISPDVNKESPDVKNEIYKELLRLEKREQKLLNPKPKSRKPKAEHISNDTATGKIERWGRDGRQGRGNGG